MVLDSLGLTALAASGLTMVENEQTLVSITPHIFVRDIQTLYTERACASGSIAVAHVLKRNLSIKQPGGEVLDVTISPGERGYITATVEGNMSVLFDGPATIVHNPVPN